MDFCPSYLVLPWHLVAILHGNKWFFRNCSLNQFQFSTKLMIKVNSASKSDSIHWWKGCTIERHWLFSISPQQLCFGNGLQTYLPTTKSLQKGHCWHKQLKSDSWSLCVHVCHNPHTTLNSCLAALLYTMWDPVQPSLDDRLRVMDRKSMLKI